MNQSYRVLVIDDDRTMRDSLSFLLEKAGFHVSCLSNAERVLQHLQTHDPDVLLCDVKMPRMSGLELQVQLKSINAVPMVLMSAHADIPMAVGAIQEGAYGFLEKPFDPRQLIKLLENAAQVHRLTQHNAQLKDRLAQLSGIDRILIGNSPAISTLRDEIVDLSSINSNVLLIGETGTGKELMARALHDLGPRAAEPFVPIHCAAIPVTKFEEMLFGVHEQSQGLLASAEGGTLFIDELGTIPLEIQSKLLRVIETKQYSPVGTIDILDADIRIVSAGQKNLQQMIKAGDFREDLYFRLNTISLNLPPLRERREDISILFAHYLSIFASTYEIKMPHLSTSDIAALMTYEWPGNVRQLQSACERHILASRRGTSSVEDAIRPFGLSHHMPETLREAVAAFESQLIGKALFEHHGRMDNVAAVLGIGRRTLNEKIVKLGLDKGKILSD